MFCSLASVVRPAISNTFGVGLRGDRGRGADGRRMRITFGIFPRSVSCKKWNRRSRCPLQTFAARMEGDDQTEVTIEPGDLDGWVKITGLEIDVGDAGSWDEPSTKQKSKPRARPRQTQNFEVEDDDNGVAEWGEVAPVASPSEASVTTPTTKGEPEMNPADQEAFDWGDQANSQSVDTAAVDVSATYNAPKLQGGELTGKPGDWECPACQYVNFGSRGECRQCKRWRADFPSGSVRVVPGDVPEGGFSADWACDECGFLNFASRQECRECDSPRPQVAAGGGNLVLGRSRNERAWGDQDGWRDGDFNRRPVGSQASRKRGGGADVKPGDWECVECGFTNFASRQECRECECPRPAWAGGRPQTEQPRMVGDWNCPECGFHNFASRDDCGECAEPRPAGTGKVKKGRDWSCPECGFVNFGSRNECRDCLLEKPAAQKRPVAAKPVQLERAPTPPGKRHGIAKRGKSMRPGEWMCRECGFTNFANRDMCFKCDHDPNA